MIFLLKNASLVLALLMVVIIINFMSLFMKWDRVQQTKQEQSSFDQNKLQIALYRGDLSPNWEIKHFARTKNEFSWWRHLNIPANGTSDRWIVSSSVVLRKMSLFCVIKDSRTNVGKRDRTQSGYNRNKDRKGIKKLKKYIFLIRPYASFSNLFIAYSWVMYRGDS